MRIRLLSNANFMYITPVIKWEQDDPRGIELSWLKGVIRIEW